MFLTVYFINLQEHRLELASGLDNLAGRPALHGTLGGRATLGGTTLGCGLCNGCRGGHLLGSSHLGGSGHLTCHLNQVVCFLYMVLIMAVFANLIFHNIISNFHKHIYL